MLTLIQIIPIIIAIFSLIMAYLGFRDKRSDKTDKDLADRIKATVLSDAVTVKAEALANSVNAKAQILSDAMALKAIEIKELQKQANECAMSHSVVKEQINSIIRNYDKVDIKLDKIIELVYSHKDDDDDTN